MWVVLAIALFIACCWAWDDNDPSDDDPRDYGDGGL
jgi:hypothetical protein